MELGAHGVDGVGVDVATGGEAGPGDRAEREQRTVAAFATSDLFTPVARGEWVRDTAPAKAVDCRAGGRFVGYGVFLLTRRMAGVFGVA